MIDAVIAATLTEACGEDPGFICEVVFDATENEALADVAEFLVGPVKVVLILLAAWIITRLVHRAIRRSIDRIIENQTEKLENMEQLSSEDEDEDSSRFQALQALAASREQRNAIQIARNKQRAETLGAVLRSVASLSIYFVAVVMALAEFNVNLGPLIAGAGIVGVALGFGAQSLVKDFLSGMFMLIEDQYGVGDIVDVGEAAGIVEAVNLRTTELRDLGGTLWHVPNGEIRRVANKSQQWSRAVLDIDVAYDTDLEFAMGVIKRVADELWQEGLPEATVLEEPQIFGVQAFGPSAITIRLGVKTEPSEQFATERILRARVKVALDEAGIEIPFPQRTIWMHQVEPDDDKGPARPPTPEAPHVEASGADEEIEV